MSAPKNNSTVVVLSGQGRAPQRLGRWGRAASWWDHWTAQVRLPAGPFGTVSATGLASVPLFLIAGALLNTVYHSFHQPMHGMELAVLALLGWTVLHRRVLLPAARRRVGEREIRDESGSAWALADAAASGVLDEALAARLIAVSEDAGAGRERIRQTALLGVRCCTMAQGSPAAEQVRSTVHATLEDLLADPAALDQPARESFVRLTESALRWRRAQREAAEPDRREDGAWTQIAGLGEQTCAELDRETATLLTDPAARR